jgi:acyl-coenzyme A thioesterase PaaI-like protein
MTTVTIDDLNNLLSQYEFTRRLGAVVTGIGDGRCTVEVPYRAENDRPGGIVSGQFYMHAADVTFWFAIKTRLGLEDDSVTSAMTSAFLGSACREGFRCTATVLRVGGRLLYGTAECAAGERLLTHHTLTYARLR